jgi:predicted nucleic acid-binding protein
MIHLDTSYLIRAMRSGADEERQLRDWIREGVELAISSAAWTEYLCGPIDPSVAKDLLSFLNEPLPFMRLDAELAAELFNQSGRRRRSTIDCMIAAAAIRAEAGLATSDLADFRRFVPAGLSIVNE